MIQFFLIERPCLIIHLCNMALALYLIYAGSSLHRNLTHTYQNAPAETLKRKSHRPLCIQGARGAILYGAMYFWASFRWLIRGDGFKIGTTDDLIWLAVEMAGILTMMKLLEIGRSVLDQATERRKRQSCRCIFENDCPVRLRCLEKQTQHV